MHAAHGQRARSLANSFARCDSTLKWLSAQPGLRSSSLLSAVSSLPYCTSSGVAPPAELALPPTGTAAYRYCRLPGANLLDAAAAIAPSAAAKVGKLFAEAAAHPHRLELTHEVRREASTWWPSRLLLAVQLGALPEHEHHDHAEDHRVAQQRRGATVAGAALAEAAEAECVCWGFLMLLLEREL